MIICVFSDAPSQVTQEVHPCLVERSHGLNYDRHKQVRLTEYSIFAGLSLSAAVSAAAPGVWDVAATYDDASVSVTVTSHVTHFPVLHGNCATPSGRLPSVLSRPDGSFTAGMSALDNARHSRSFNAWCRADRPVPPLQERPRSPLASRDAPQGHWCGSHILAPSLSPRRCGCLYRPVWGHNLTTGRRAASQRCVETEIDRKIPLSKNQWQSNIRYCHVFLCYNENEN